VNGITKYAAEQLHHLYHDVYGLRASTVRLTNVYGPRQRLTDDLQGFLPIFLRRALAGDTISVFGEGDQQRDCLYVDDVVECLELAALTPDAAGQIFNVGNDERRRSRRLRSRSSTSSGAGGWSTSPGSRPRRDRHRLLLRRLVEGEAPARLGAAHAVRRGMARTVAFYRDRMAWYS